MRKAFLVVGLIALLNSVPLNQSRASTATQCTGPLPPGTYSDVVVPEGHVCSLQRVILLGNVTIERNAALQVESSTILGLLQGRGGHFLKTSQIPTGVSGGGSRIGQIDI